MSLHGHNIIGGAAARGGGGVYRGVDPVSGRELPPDFFEADDADVDQSVRLAAEAFDDLRRRPAAQRANLLREIAGGIEALGDDLIERADQETALGLDRLRGERGRTVGQLRMFAELIEEGSWVGARIDHAIPARQPVPKPDVRRMLIPLGPVIVFGAGNFPLAFSVAGGDTASALAAGCPVIVKVHPAHPGTSELVGSAIARAVAKTGLAAGTFSMLHGRDPALGLALVRHPLSAAVAFTGSLKAGRALFDAAAVRPRPIPVHAEMGSVNPLFVLPGAAAERAQQIAQGLKQSVTLGTGQFCTKPGVVVALDGPATRSFISAATELMRAAPPGAMLHAGIHSAYSAGIRETSQIPGVQVIVAPPADTDKAMPTVFVTDAKTFQRNARLGEELFGPSVVLVTTSSRQEMLAIARDLHGHLTATIHGTPDDLRDFAQLVDILQMKVGRLIFNGFPTGVEVCPSMHHGGPYPATTDSRTTSVGTAAIERFVRPICYQNFPGESLPPELRDDNTLGIWRIVDGKWTNDKRILGSPRER